MMKKVEREIILNMDMVNGKMEAVGPEERAAHGSVVGAVIRGWRMPSMPRSAAGLGQA
ncbi:MAG: hypothetical protein ACI3ZF_05250 [Candidatus Cryptobacteroides sp.]